MSDFVRDGDRLINLDRVEVIRLGRPTPKGRPGKCHEVCFHVSGFEADDRLIRFGDETPEGRALLAYVEGEPERPVISIADPVASEIVAIANGWTPNHGVAEACTDSSTDRRGA